MCEHRCRVYRHNESGANRIRISHYRPRYCLTGHDQPIRNVVYATATGTNEIAAIDATTHQVTKRAATGPFPDGLAFDPDDNMVLVSNKTAGTISIHDADTLALIRTIKLGAETGVRYAYVACENNARLAVVDLTTKAPTAMMTVAAGPDVLAIDPARRRLYVAAESGDVDLFDITAGPAIKIGSQHVNGDAHSIAVDPTTHLVYVPLASVDGHPVLRIFH